MLSVGSNTPFETSEKPTDPTTPTDPTDRLTQPSPNSLTSLLRKQKAPRPEDSSNMMLWIGLMLASCGGVIGMAVYSKRKKLHAK